MKISFCRINGGRVRRKNFVMNIIGKRIYLKILTVEDNLANYLRWMNDPEVVRFTESKGKVYSEQDLLSYIKSVSNSQNYFFGIFLQKDGRHIGNIKLGNIHSVHKRADIGIIIGEKDLWRHGFGQEAIELLTDHAFKHLNLKKVWAGMFVNNIGSYKTFLKAGFKECGRQKDHSFLEGKFVDGILVEKINQEYRDSEIARIV